MQTKMNKIQWVSSIVLLLFAFLLHLAVGESHLRGLEQGDVQEDHAGKHEGLLHGFLHLLAWPFVTVYCAAMGDHHCH